MICYKETRLLDNRSRWSKWQSQYSIWYCYRTSWFFSYRIQKLVFLLIVAGSDVLNSVKCHGSGQEVRGGGGVTFSSFLFPGEGSTNNSPSALFFFFFLVEISSRAPVRLFKPEPVHSGFASWEDCVIARLLHIAVSLMFQQAYDYDCVIRVRSYGAVRKELFFKSI